MILKSLLSLRAPPSCGALQGETLSDPSRSSRFPDQPFQLCLITRSYAQNPINCIGPLRRPDCTLSHLNDALVRKNSCLRDCILLGDNRPVTQSIAIAVLLIPCSNHESYGSYPGSLADGHQPAPGDLGPRDLVPTLSSVATDGLVQASLRYPTLNFDRFHQPCL